MSFKSPNYEDAGRGCPLSDVRASQPLSEASKIYPHDAFISIMRELIAYCGLDCEKCEAYIATLNDDDVLRRKVAKEWSELNNVDITPDMINCQGCRVKGKKTPFCDSMCPIRQCAMGKDMETCGSCAEMKDCKKVAMVIDNNTEALANLNGSR